MKSIIIFLLLAAWLFCTLILSLTILGILLVTDLSDGGWFQFPRKLIDKL